MDILSHCCYYWVCIIASVSRFYQLLFHSFTVSSPPVFVITKAIPAGITSARELTPIQQYITDKKYASIYIS